MERTTYAYNAMGEQTEVTSPSVNSGSGVSSTTDTTPTAR